MRAPYRPARTVAAVPLKKKDFQVQAVAGLLLRRRRLTIIDKVALISILKCLLLKVSILSRLGFAVVIDQEGFEDVTDGRREDSYVKTRRASRVYI